MNAYLDAVGATPRMRRSTTTAETNTRDRARMCVDWIRGISQRTFCSSWLSGVAGRNQTLPSMTARFLPWVGWGVLVLLVTGVLLMIAEPRRALLNPLFQLKMAALLIVGLITWAIARAPDQGWTDPARRGVATSVAIGSLLLWLAIIGLGRWIAYGP